MKMNEVTFGTELVVEAGKNGNGHSHSPAPGEDSYQAAYEAGVATGREAAYRAGYQAGFADGFKPSQEGAGNAASAASPGPKKINGILKRLRGLPCTHCGVSMYSDESSCRCCGTPKAAQTERMEQPS